MSEELNGYQLSRNWFNFSFENPDMVRPIHTAIFMWAIEKCNRLGWKKKFGFPTSHAMDAIGVKSKNTYLKALNDLVEWGFIEMIQESKNQHTANIIAISKFNTAHDTALDKATAHHAHQHLNATPFGTDTINKPLNKETNKQGNNTSLVEPDGSDVKETEIERLARLNDMTVELAETELGDLSTGYFKSPKEDASIGDGLNFLTMSFFEALPDDVKTDKTVYSKKFVKWRNKIRLMHTEDERTLKEIYKGVLAFKNDQFWNNTCQSTGNFRDNYLKIIQSQSKDETTKNQEKSRADRYFDTAQEVIGRFKKADTN